MKKDKILLTLYYVYLFSRIHKSGCLKGVPRTFSRGSSSLSSKLGFSGEEKWEK